MSSKQSNKQIKRLIERSSLGTPAAKSARRSVSRKRGVMLAHAATAQAADRSTTCRSGQNDGGVRV